MIEECVYVEPVIEDRRRLCGKADSAELESDDSPGLSKTWITLCFPCFEAIQIPIRPSVFEYLAALKGRF